MTTYLRLKDQQAKTRCAVCTDDKPPIAEDISDLHHGDIICDSRPRNDPSGRLYYVYAVIENAGEPKTTIRITDCSFPTSVTSKIESPVDFYRPSFIPMKIYLDNVAHKDILKDQEGTIYFDCIDKRYYQDTS
jgi:hypothetical protein